MNRRMIANTVGKMIVIEAFALFIPLVISLIYQEKSFLSFVISAIIAFAVGGFFILISRNPKKVIYAKEGFLIVALSWIFASLIGCLPFIISGEIPNFFDAIFETVSGFTTTGASILKDVTALSNGMLFWRSFTHYIGGIGVLVFVVALIPDVSGRTIYILRAEMPGPTFGKLSPKLKDTVKILLLIYFGLTALEVIMLLFGGMPLFDSVVHSIGTAGTGGFGIKADSIGSYSPYCQWVIAAFMFMFAINFNLYYLLIAKRISAFFKNNELWLYITIVLGATAAITVNLMSVYENFADALRHSAFQVTSLVSTTGYATADFNNWPIFSKSIIFILMFLGGCAGSTCGGFKTSRLLILFKLIKAELHKMLHPRSVVSVKVDGKAVEENVLRSVSIYFAVYSAIIAITFLLISFEPFNIETNLTAAVSCFNNVGPGLSLIGPAGSYADYSAFSKVILSFAMLFGRLEIFPLLLAFNPKTWVRR